MRWLPLLLLLSACTCSEPAPAPTPATSTTAAPVIPPDRIPPKRPPSNAPTFAPRTVHQRVDTEAPPLQADLPGSVSLDPPERDEPETPSAPGP